MSIEDNSVFPAPVFKDTVLGPLFEKVKAHHTEPFRRINHAHCVMLAETDLLTPEQAKSIAAALLDVDTQMDAASLVYDGTVEDFFFHVERELVGRLGADLAGRLHTGRSRNDIDHTIFKMSLKRAIDQTAAKARALCAAMISKAEAEAETLIVAYTHGQPAQPSTFGHYLAAGIEGLLRDLERLEAARHTCDLCSMGAAAITTTGFAIDRHRMAELLGFSDPQQNAYGCIAAVDYVTSTYSALQLIALHLGRIAQDLQHWSSFEVGQLYVPNAYVQISSIMPQKRNPVPVEHLRLLLSLAFGRANGMLSVMHNTPFTDMNDSEGEVQTGGYAAFEALDRALDLMTGLIGAVSINTEMVTRNTDRACITITELADGLVRVEGLAFRAAHEIASEVARTVVAAGQSLGDAGYPSFCGAFATQTGRP
ncbi:MAG: argininosuccinate lyase, partial [Pseudomonadota bacterium]